MLSRFLIISLCLAANGLAEMRLSLNPTNPTLGENATLELKLINEKGRIQRFGPTKKAEGFNINWNNVRTSQSNSFVNGTTTHEISLTWTIQATSLGAKTIPPLQVFFDSGARQTKALPFKVVPAQKSDFYLLQTRLDRESLPLGGVATLEIDICLADQEVRKVENSIGGYELAQNHYDDINLPQSLLDQFHVEVLQGRESNKGTWFGVSVKQRIINGFPYRVHRLKLELEPKSSGRLEIPALSIPFYRLGNFKRTWIGRVSASRVGRAIRSEAPPLYLKVTPPPKEGQPIHFQGQVCEKLQINIEIEDLEAGGKIQLHSPLSLTLTLNSDRRGSSMALPNFKTQTPWKDFFDINTSAMVREDLKNSAVFSGIIVRPKNKDLKAIPPIEVPYFSLVDQSYHIAKSQALPVTIETIDDATLLDDRAVEVLLVEKEEQKQKTVSRLHGLEMDVTRLKTAPSSVYPWAWIGPLVLFPWASGLWMAWLLPMWRHRNQHSQSSFQSSFVMNSLGEVKTPTQMLDLFSKYLLHQHQCQDPSNFNNTDTTLQNELRSLVRDLEQAGYGLQSNESDLSQRTLKMIQRLESLR